LRRRATGEDVAEGAVVAAYPQFSTELKDQFAVLRQVEAARVLAALPTVRSGNDKSPAAFPHLPGYVILGELSRGGQSQVYLAKYLDHESLVAVKFIADHRLGDPSERCRLRQEFELLRSLDHPGVLKVIEHGTTSQGHDFITTRFVEGSPLRPDRLAESQSVDERLLLFRQICRAVAVAHAKGVVHRDIKPSNIRIDRAGRPHLLDFGLATVLDAESLRQSLTATGEFVGTFLWASPEQKRGGQPITPASDVYSLGVILHQLLAGGQFPPQTYESFESVVTDCSPRGTRRYPAIRNRAIRRVLAKCLAIDPTARYPDAASLEQAVSTIPTRRTGRRLLIALLASGLSLTAVGSVGWRVWGPKATRNDMSWTQASAGRPILHLPNLPPLAFIPPGEFEMGSGEAENGYPDERPRRRVTIDRGFFMGIYEISQAQYQAVMGSNPARFTGAAARPVERVSYHDAVEFCRRVSEQTGRVVRLPTEAEWEYAARAGSAARFSFGDDERLSLRYANFADLSNASPALPGRMDYDDGFPQTAEVGRFVSNDFFLYDMHGNVWEWCQGPYLIDPIDPTTARTDLASARGGSWWDMPGAGRSANRNPLKLDEKVSTLGFRVVAEEKVTTSP
jgi:formylglycine-generating enzyme required for sulfatase activity/tRNA A-37 threonylcarbamoyl transferase component Bud32